ARRDAAGDPGRLPSREPGRAAPARTPELHPAPAPPHRARHRVRADRPDHGPARGRARGRGGARRATPPRPAPLPAGPLRLNPGAVCTRLMSFLGALAVLVCAWVAPASAQAQEPGDGLAPTMVVLDASGSMNGADPAGGTRMDAARQAVHAFLDAAPDGAPVGLAAYGTSTGNSDAERDQGCRDVTVVRPVGPLDRAGLGAAVDDLTPRGYTPIGRSLQVAAEELPQEGPRSIVLVSDGVDTCAPPEPCEVVRTLAGQGVDLVVHAVGFGVDDEARAELSCIAQATGGTYTDAPDADALRRVLPRVAGSALRNYEPAGTPITGAPTVAAAPVAAPGQHLDTIGRHEQRHYAVDVPEGATAYFSATVSFPRLSGVSATSDFNVLELRTF